MLEKISILIPVYNRELYLPKALQSAITQTYKNLEIIIYNDGSTDKSDEIIKQFQHKDSRITYISNPDNHGVSHARNDLINACTTNYAMWLDSDDIIHPKKVDIQLIEIQKKSQLIFTYWHWYKFTTSNKWKSDFTIEDTQAFATLMFPVDKTIRFDNKYQIGGEDWTWIAEMKKKYSETTIKQDLYAVRLHNDRIGYWKRIFSACFDKKDIETLTYGELMKKYKDKYVR